MNLTKNERTILIATLEHTIDNFEDFDYMDYPNEVSTIKNILQRLKKYELKYENKKKVD